MREEVQAVRPWIPHLRALPLAGAAPRRRRYLSERAAAAARPNGYSLLRRVEPYRRCRIAQSGTRALYATTGFYGSRRLVLHHFRVAAGAVESPFCAWVPRRHAEFVRMSRDLKRHPLTASLTERSLSRLVSPEAIRVFGRQAGAEVGPWRIRARSTRPCPCGDGCWRVDRVVSSTQRDRSPSPGKWAGRPVGAGCRASLRAAQSAWWGAATARRVQSLSRARHRGGDHAVTRQRERRRHVRRPKNKLLEPPHARLAGCSAGRGSGCSLGVRSGRDRLRGGVGAPRITRSAPPVTG